MASTATYEFMKLTDKFKSCSSFNQHYEVILDNVVKVIQACANGQISEDSLGHDEVRYLYGILSVITADSQPIVDETQRLDEGKRLEVVNWALNQQVAELQKCPAGNKDKLCRIIANIKTITSSFRSGCDEGFKDSYKQLVQHLGQVLSAHLDHEDLTN